MSVPDVPEVMLSQAPEVTDAVQGIEPVPMFSTEKLVEPASDPTDRSAGRTERIEGVSSVCVTVTSKGVFIESVAVTRMTPWRIVPLVLAV